MKKIILFIVFLMILPCNIIYANSIYAIKRTNTESGRTEVHVLNRSNNFHNFKLQIATALNKTGTGNDWSFGVGPFRSGGSGFLDLYAIKRANTESGRTEVHILNGTNRFRTFSLHVPTALHETGTGNNWAFGVGKHGSLYAIKRANTGTGTTEVHVLSRTNNFRTFSLQTGTALHETGTGKHWDFCIGDYNGDDIDDVYAIKRANTGTGTTEVHVLSGASRFRRFLIQTGTALHETGISGHWVFATGDYDGDGCDDVYAIKKDNTGTGRTEVHILDAGNSFKSFLLQTGTALNKTGFNRVFDFCAQ